MMNEPIFFAPNRVWRCYLGGKLLDRFVGKPEGPDDYFPEDWLASVTQAINGEHSQGPQEGLVRTLKADGTPGELFAEAAEVPARGLAGGRPRQEVRPQHGRVVQVPRFGRASADPVPPGPRPGQAALPQPLRQDRDWTILDTRTVNGEEPYLLMGFRPGATRQELARTMYEQDIPAMVNLLNKIPAEVGKTYFVPGRMPHAIGPGVFMLEVQEPTDWVIHSERLCAGTRLSDESMYGPLSPEQCLDVFDYEGLTVEQLLARVACPPRTVRRELGGSIRRVIGEKLTPAFGLLRVEVKGRLTVELPRPFGIIVVAAGQGTMSWPTGQKAVGRGDYFFQPAGAER